MAQPYFEDVTPGTELPPLVKRPTNVSVFLYGVALWTAHRIHYDADHARSEGYPNVLVTGGIMGAYLVQMLVSWAGLPTSLRKLSLSYRALAHPGDTLTARGIVRRTYREDGLNLAYCDVFVENQEGARPVVGSAVVSLPSRP